MPEATTVAHLKSTAAKLVYMKEYHARPESRQKRAEWIKKNRESLRKENKRRHSHYETLPEYKKKRSEYMKKYNARPDVKKRMREYSRRPEVVARRLEKAATPEARKKQSAKSTSPEGRKYFREYQKSRRADENFRILHCLRSRLLSAFELTGAKKCASTLELVGCDIGHLKKYLESQFTEGMTWENHSKDGWHIDHVIPCSKFDLSCHEHQRVCFHFTNLQPLWAKDNCRKHATLRCASCADSIEFIQNGFIHVPVMRTKVGDVTVTFTQLHFCHRDHFISWLKKHGEPSAIISATNDTRGPSA